MTHPLPHTDSRVTTLVDLLRDRATGPCADRGFSFFRGDDAPDEWLSYAELEETGRRIAAKLLRSGPLKTNPRQTHSETPARAIILCPPGPAYVKALFGVMQAGLVAVTAYPPRARRTDERLDGVIDDSAASIVLVDDTLDGRRELFQRGTRRLQDLPWVNVDALDGFSAEDAEPASSTAEDLAILQYTSGSTRAPKGVRLTHRNLMSNLQMIYQGFELERCRDEWGVTWLPPYHDMGLIGGLLQIVYSGTSSHVMPPASFVQKPFRWLRAITKFGASVSGAPNFAYDLCVDRISDDERASLDLSSWTLAFTGAEPIRPATLRRFAEAFAPCRFSPSSFYPCYGLAEATLLVSGGPRETEPRLRDLDDLVNMEVDETELQEKPGPSLVSCGPVTEGQQVRIVDPDSNQCLVDGTIGEICIAGPNVTDGYWRADGSVDDSLLSPIDGEMGRFLRTGDLGLFDGGELFVAGRLKELIVIRGRNFQPADIEDAIGRVSEAFVRNATACFSIDTERGSSLVVVQEVKSDDAADLESLSDQIRERVIDSFDLDPHRILLIRQRTLPKTSSGKIKRLEVKRLFESGELQTLQDAAPSVRPERSPREHGVSSPAGSRRPVQATDGSVVRPRAEEVSKWLSERIASQLGIGPEQVDTTRPFSRYGLDSVSAVQIASELESFVGEEIPATLFYDAPTIGAVSRRLGRGDQTTKSESQGHAPNSRSIAEPIAVVGVACRLPGADSVEQFWQMLLQGRSAISDPPKGREGCVSPDATTRSTGWISHPEEFDAAFFGISPREANVMDPQHRLLLETGWRAIENSACDPKRLAGTRTGAFVGISNRDYERLLLNSGVDRSTYSMTGNAASMAAHRLSYHLDLQGPSVAIDTACSSSLVALHQAVRALQADDCDSALVAGVNLILSPEVSDTLSDADMLSPDGLCKSFDASANGYVRGEGCVAILLKPLSVAMAEGAPVHAVIAGSAINQDGLTNGITAPNGESQRRLYRQALRDASVDAKQISFVEAHGTGTVLGDPIEWAGLREVYGGISPDYPVCEVGAVKANVGHLEAAAGLASFLKLVLVLSKRTSVPQPNLRTLNPQIELDGSRLRIPQQPCPWNDAGPRLGAVSSFGFGGTNAHLIVSEAGPANDLKGAGFERAAGIGDECSTDELPPVPVAQLDAKRQVPSSLSLVTLSAFSDEALYQMASEHARVFDADADLASLAHATQLQKATQPHRLALVAETSSAVASHLRSFSSQAAVVSGESGRHFFTGVAPANGRADVAFLFTGQGGQHLGMGRDLYQGVPAFRQSVDRCDALLLDEFGYQVSDLLSAESSEKGPLSRRLFGPAAETALHVLQVALARAFRSVGLMPSAVLGHSMGEFAAASVAGVMSWEDALRLTASRAQALAGLRRRGAMLVIFAPLDDVMKLLTESDGGAELAAIDGPEHVVVSGTSDAIHRFEKTLSRGGLLSKRLPLSQAFHSELIEPVLDTLRRAVSRSELRRPQVTYVSGLTGEVAIEELCEVDYWVRQSRQPVQFVKAIRSLDALSCPLAVELGPHPTLCTLAESNAPLSIECLPVLDRNKVGASAWLAALGKLFVRGVDLQPLLSAQPTESRPAAVVLPGHPFRRKTFWFDSSASQLGTACGPDRDTAAEHAETETTTELSGNAVARVVDDIILARPPELAGRTTDTELTEYHEATGAFDQLVAKAMMATLVAVGVPESRRTICPQLLIDEGIWLARHRRLAERICGILAEEGLLAPVVASSADAASPNDAWEVKSAADWSGTAIADFRFACREVEQRFPFAANEVGLISRCGGSLSDVLKGAVDPLGLLFPDGDSSELEELYRASPLAARSNQLVADVASAVVKRLGQSERQLAKPTVRVLEVGAGTGGTTSYLLPAILGDVKTYCFTDTSPLLVARSRERFGDVGPLEYQVLDLERSPAEQGFTDRAFDIVVAANVLHATRDLRQSLQNVKRLVRPGGVLIALEGTRPERFLDLIFGLTEGWWRFADAPLRESYPLLARDQWIKLLGEEGFAEPAAVPYPDGQRLAEASQSVLIAGIPTSSTSDDEPGDATPLIRMRPSVVESEMGPLAEAFREASGDRRRETLEVYLRQAVAAVLGHRPDELDLQQPVSNLGLDSLMAIQLKNRMEKDLGVSIPMVTFLQGKSVSQLIEVALEQSAEDESLTPTQVSRPVNSSMAADVRDPAEEVDPKASGRVEVEPVSEDRRHFAKNQMDSIPAAPIVPSEARILGPMSSGQLALWMIHQRTPQCAAYNFAFAAKSTRDVDVQALDRACQALVKRHPALRTRYEMIDGEPLRILEPASTVVIEQHDCRDWAEERLVSHVRMVAEKPFDLQTGPVIRFSLLRSRTGDVLSIAMHHIAGDLWSMDVLIQELLDLYAMIVGGGTIELGPLPTTYDSYVQWEKGLEGGEEGDRLWAFWEEKLRGAPHTLNLPTSFPRPSEQTFSGKSFEWSMPADVVEALRDVANAERTTLFTIVLAAYQAFLARICGQDDLLVGTVSASRGRSEWEGIVGYFLNHLVLRTRIAGSPSFRDLLRDSQREVLDALDNQAFPFAKLVERLSPRRDASRSPLVQTMFIWDKPRNLKESHFAPGKSSDRLRLRPILMEQCGAPFDLTLIVFELEDEFQLTFRYNTDLFSDRFIENLAESLQTFVEAVAKDPDIPVRSAGLVSARQESALDRWNDTDMPFDPTLSAYPLFRKWVEETPDALAFDSTAKRLSYSEASEQVDRLANRLIRHGVQPGDLVGLSARRHVDSIVAILAIWKIGAVYLPLDPDLPAARRSAILTDAKPRLVLVDAAAEEEGVSECQVETVRLVERGEKGGNGAEVRGGVADEVTQVDPSAPAYVIYTSGSTGRPKGVVLAHRGIANLAAAQAKTFGVRPYDRCLQFASLSFDASVFEFMMSLHAGASLYVLDATVLRSSMEQVGQSIRDSRVTVATLPPALLSVLTPDRLDDLRVVISAGEACPVEVVETWGQGRRFFNAYGPTETTVWASTSECSDSGAAPTLGRTIANVRAHILDSDLQPRPLGVAGELCLAGPGLAVGYRNLPVATGEAFVPNPFSDRFDATLYRTGDLARWTDEGELQFLGRIDDQVKIDGHRIELGEVATLIRRNSDVKEVCLRVGTEKASRTLIAYVVPRRDEVGIDVGNLREQLSSSLPCYMIPQQFVRIQSVPMTVNGKVDFDRLPDPVVPTVGTMRTADVEMTETETVLRDIWREVLGIDVIGLRDNFFELGGASLKALQAADLAAKAGLTITSEQMFRFQTISELARDIDQNGGQSDEQPAATGAGIGPEQVTPFDASDTEGDSESFAPAQGHTSPESEQASVARESLSQPKMVIESLGCYLPPKSVATSDVINGCRKTLDFPLQRMTGIQSRRVAGEEEFSIDLARKAAQDCLSKSRFDAGDIDLIIAANISRYDAPDFTISYEPSTASTLKRLLGAERAMAFDLCNACAGFFTALAVAEAKLKRGQVRRAMVVSGEYITHLTKTAQKEIDGFLDPRLACLTLGDAGAAVIVELSDRGGGFESLDLYSAGRHHDLCVAQATDRGKNAAIMLTDAIKASAVTLDHSVGHAMRVMNRHRWDAQQIRHVVMHQTSSTTLEGAMDELNRQWGANVCSAANTVNNLRQRGNTASTTHWVAIADMIREGKIRDGDHAVFAVSGSGQTIGTALYQFDDLPSRMSSPPSVMTARREDRSAVVDAVDRDKVGGVVVVAAHVQKEAEPNQGDVNVRYSTYGVIEAAARSAAGCLQAAGWDPGEVGILAHCGVYRDQYLSEPAVAAILAGELNMNCDGPSENGNQTLAFDVADSGRGALVGCDALVSLILSGNANKAMLTASETENNPADHDRRGVAEIGSALALARSDRGDVGFGEFFFRSFPEFASRLQVATTLTEGEIRLSIQQEASYGDDLVRCMARCVAAFRENGGGPTSSYDRVLVAAPTDLVRRSIGAALGVSDDRLVLPRTANGDAFTSGLANMWVALAEREPPASGERWLIVAAGAGIEVACVEYVHE